MHYQNHHTDQYRDTDVHLKNSPATYKLTALGPEQLRRDYSAVVNEDQKWRYWITRDFSTVKRCAALQFLTIKNAAS